MSKSQDQDQGFTAKVVEMFLTGNLPILLIIVMLAAGAAALILTPREEDPQIVVPLADVFIRMPGASAEEVEQQVASRLERLLMQVDGVEYVYSMSRPGEAVVTVKFFVGEHRENSLVKLHNKISMSADQVPPGVTGWVVKPIEIDDVPFVNITLTSKTVDDFTLRRVAEQVEVGLQSVHDTARTEVVGGRKRQLRVLLDPERMAARQVTPLDVDRVLRAANVNMRAGTLRAADKEVTVESGPFIRDTAELESLVVGVHDGRPTRLGEIAKAVDGPEEPGNITRIRFGAGSERSSSEDQAAVTVGVAKRKGSNAVSVAQAIESRLESLRGSIIPHDIEAIVTRNNGETADEKVTELIRELGLAIIIVSALIIFSLGWREALIVVTAVPLTFALTLLVNYLAGYSINRVTLFALILALGLVVDDPIVDVENIFRHFAMRLRPPMESVLAAVNEVRPPIIVATLVVMVSFIPMVFITGMMGPYMRPMALNVPVAMFMSMVVAFTITPWLSLHVLKGVYGKGGHEPEEPSQTSIYRVYRAILMPLLNSKWLAWGLILVTTGLLLASMALPAMGLVPLKMLPFDNKNELQVLVDLPEGSTMENTDAVLQEMADLVCSANEVREVLSYAGTSSPMDFNGMVRHYYLRHEPNRGDLRVNLLPREERKAMSHEVALRLRPQLQEIANRHKAVLQIVEVPPGPPVLNTLVAEVYPQPGQSLESLRADTLHLRQQFASEPGVVDVDDTFEEPRDRLVFKVDREKASLTGVSVEEIANTLRVGLDGMTPGEGNVQHFRAGAAHLPRELNPLSILVQLPQAQRGGVADLTRLGVKTPTGKIVQISELGAFERLPAEQVIYHKNQRRVAFVQADTAGRTPAEAVLGLMFKHAKAPCPNGAEVVWTGEGEWKITLDVFRDLGLAFAGAMLLIYILMVQQTGSYLIPLVQMISIPLTIIGIMPGFWLLNLYVGNTIGGYANPVYFTATAMIGMIALAGIADRNAILLIDFIQHVRARGVNLKDALVESGAVRIRPILLTAGAAMLGAWPITLDPVFSGLAWSLIFGLVVSTAFTLVLVPVVYHMLYEEKRPQ